MTIFKVKEVEHYVKPNVQIFYLYIAVLVLFLLTGIAYAAPLHVSIEVPPGTKNYTVVSPNSTVFGYIILESQVNRPLKCRVNILTLGCALNVPSAYLVKFRFRYDSKVIYVNLTTTSRECIIKVKALCGNAVIRTSKVLLTSASKVTVSLIIPSDSLCHFESKLEKYVLVVRTSLSPLLSLLTGLGKRAHPDFIGFGCIRVNGSGMYTAVLIFRSPGGGLAPISVTSAAFSGGVPSSHPGVIILSGFTKYVVFPLFSQTDPRNLVGTYLVDLYLYRYGSEKPILHKTYRVRIVVLDQTALELVMFSGLVAVPFFTFATFRSLRKIEIKELLLCALTACLIFTTAILPGYVLWGISAALGPFDWVVYGIAWSMIRMIYYAIIVMITQRPGTFTLLMFIVWILNTLFFGRLSVVSLLWVATSSLLYEPLLYATGVTRGKPSLSRLLAAFMVATPLDHYVDLMLYMTLYRLYYADWYVAMYVIGTSAYSIAGAFLGAKLSRDLRVVIHE